MRQKRLLALTALLAAMTAQAAEMKLWYDKPATIWEQEALPIGNGRLAAMLFGGAPREHIQFNEESLWIGDEKETGAYQAFGDIFVDLAHGAVTNYRRELDIARALHTVTYESGGVKYRRESFASFPAKVMVFRFTADKSGALTGAITLADMHDGKIRTGKSRITATGSVQGYKYAGGSASKDAPPYNILLQYEAQVVVLNDGGTLEVAGEEISFKNANSVTLLLDAGTDFVQDRSKGWRGEPPHNAITARLAAAAQMPYEGLLAGHVKDFQELSGRVALDLGQGSDLPTDKRLAAYKTGANDPGLESLLFQFGRYLLASSSRRGTLPANLQGKWNQSNNPPWRCDYHTDINVQMNYWPADAANLSECFEPFANWLNSIREVRTAETKTAFHARGWTMHGENGLFGGSTWAWVLPSSAWCMQNIWEHYAFTGDKEYLRTLAYPMMKEVCEFWIDSLKALPDGTLISPSGFSPEHHPNHGKSIEGVSFDQELVWDLFNSTVEATDVLGIDREFRDMLAAKRDKLLVPKIGKWGQLQEWMEDLDDPKDHHRHLSHLIALHPGRQISPLKTPQLAEAAKASLIARGDGETGWSKIWKINLWARLLDGDHAHKIINGWISDSVYPNLLDTCPPFEIDGNFGYTAAICEMLVQSHLGEIHLLPALPKIWNSGNVRGLRARGGFTVDIEWKDGNVTRYSIASPEPREVKVHANGETKTIQSAKM